MGVSEPEGSAVVDSRGLRVAERVRDVAVRLGVGVPGGVPALDSGRVRVVDRMPDRETVGVGEGPGVRELEGRGDGVALPDRERLGGRVRVREATRPGLPLRLRVAVARSEGVREEGDAEGLAEAVGRRDAVGAAAQDGVGERVGGWLGVAVSWLLPVPLGRRLQEPVEDGGERERAADGVSDACAEPVAVATSVSVPVRLPGTVRDPEGIADGVARPVGDAVAERVGEGERLVRDALAVGRGLPVWVGVAAPDGHPEADGDGVSVAVSRCRAVAEGDAVEDWDNVRLAVWGGVAVGARVGEREAPDVRERVPEAVRELGSVRGREAVGVAVPVPEGPPLEEGVRDSVAAALADRDPAGLAVAVVLREALADREVVAVRPRNAVTVAVGLGEADGVGRQVHVAVAVGLGDEAERVRDSGRDAVGVALAGPWHVLERLQVAEVAVAVGGVLEGVRVGVRLAEGVGLADGLPLSASDMEPVGVREPVRRDDAVPVRVRHAVPVAKAGSEAVGDGVGVRRAVQVRACDGLSVRIADRDSERRPLGVLVGLGVTDALQVGARSRVTVTVAVQRDVSVALTVGGSVRLTVGPSEGLAVGLGLGAEGEAMREGVAVWLWVGEGPGDGVAVAERPAEEERLGLGVRVSEAVRLGEAVERVAVAEGVWDAGRDRLRLRVREGAADGVAVGVARPEREGDPVAVVPCVEVSEADSEALEEGEALPAGRPLRDAVAVCVRLGEGVWVWRRVPN